MFFKDWLSGILLISFDFAVSEYMKSFNVKSAVSLVSAPSINSGVVRLYESLSLSILAYFASN